MIRTKKTKTLALGVALSVLTACSPAPVEKATAENLVIKKEATATKLATVQELVRGNASEVASVDPHKTEGVPEANVINDLFEGLVNQSEDGGIVPAVATHWETSDNKTFIFHLRDTAKWSNGDPVTAHDFVYSFQREVDPKTASPSSAYISGTTMLNADSIIAGKKDKSTLGVKAIDDLTLEIKLEKPVPYFVSMLAHRAVKPVPKKSIAKYGDDWSKPANIVTNGAFVLSKWVVNERIELTRNKYYWDDKNVKLTKVTFLPIESQTSEMNRFLAGEIHFTSGVSSDHFNSLKKSNADSLVVKGTLNTYYYQMNIKKPPFDDVRVRQAVSYAVDRNIISDVILAQGQKPSYFFTPEIVANFSPELPDYAKITQEERNSRAKALLSEAGYDQSNPLSFTLLYNTSDEHKKIAVAIASMWKKSLGANVTLENQEWKTYLESRKQGSFQITRASWGGDYNEASTFTSLLEGKNVLGGIHYKSNAYDKLVRAALNEGSEKARTEIYYQQEALLAKDMPIIPIYQYVSARLISPNLRGYAKGNALDTNYSKDMYFVAE